MEERRRECRKLRIARRRIPIEPAHLVILTKCVVVALLRARELVAHEQHRDALQTEAASRGDALLAGAARPGLRILRWTFGAAVPGEVVAVAVPIVLSVRLVVALVVTHEIFEREAVVRADVVDGSRGVATPGSKISRDPVITRAS